MCYRPVRKSKTAFHILLYFTKGRYMFHDLKKAFEKVQEDLVVISGRNDKIIVRESVWKEFEQEFNICFVEPEDDVEHQLWVENDDVI